MRQKTGPAKEPAEQVVKDIRRATRRHFSAEDKIRIVLEGLRGEDSIAGLCRREGIVQNLYYRWSKDFLEAGKKRLAGDTARAATVEVAAACRASRPRIRWRTWAPEINGALLASGVYTDASRCPRRARFQDAAAVGLLTCGG